VSATGNNVAALSGEFLLILTGGGRRISKQVPLPGGRDLAVLPEKAKSAVPAGRCPKTLTRRATGTPKKD
jgi:hypothetical protein